MTYKTLQELFDTASNHLLTQMEKSEDAGVCLYRGPNNLKCAVGALIPDSAYIPEIENCLAEQLFSRYRDVLEESNIDPHSMRIEDLLSNLQAIHDMSDPEEWEHDLSLVAKNFNLNFNPKG